MVFAVWAAQRDCDPDALARVDRALRGAVAEASEHVLRFDWAEVARETTAVYERLVVARRERSGAT